VFIWLIIRLIQLVFLAGTVFFSQKKSVNSVFQPAYNSSRTAPELLLDVARAACLEEMALFFSVETGIHG
jgi:hypothetical protein